MAKPAAQWKFVADDADVGGSSIPTKQRRKSPDSISWSVSDSMFHQKSVLWYVYLLLATLIFAALIYLLTRDKITIGIIIFGGLVMAYYASQRPAVIEYQLDDSSITIGQKVRPLSAYRSFFSVNEIKGTSIVLIPLKRFSPAVTLYSAPKEATKVLDFLSNKLPMDKNREDVLDRFMRQIKF